METEEWQVGQTQQTQVVLASKPHPLHANFFFSATFAPLVMGIRNKTALRPIPSAHIA